MISGYGGRKVPTYLSRSTNSPTITLIKSPNFELCFIIAEFGDYDSPKYIQYSPMTIVITGIKIGYSCYFDFGIS